METNHKSKKQVHPVSQAARDVQEDALYKALQESEERFRLAFRISPDSININRLADGLYVDINEGFTAILGYTREDVIGKPSLEIGIWENPADRQRLVKGLRESGIVHNLEAKFRRKDGSLTDGLMSARIIMLRDVPHILSVTRDIGELKRAEEKIHNLNAELEQRVVERTAQLLAANKELESFSYSVSHDLRAPLRSINGFAQMLGSLYGGALDEEGLHYLDRIVKASERMGHLIDDLLNYSRLGRQGLKVGPVSLANILADIAQDLQPRLDETGGTLAIGDDLPVVMGDHTLLTQVFTNLLDNAILYHKPGVPVQVDVSCRVEDQSILIAVSDNGIGIDPQYQDQIFNVFQRLQTDVQYPGTGIGLPIVKKSLELLGGSVWVQSKLGEGSQFYVKLPKA